jgi:hypothetical protein
LRGDPRNPDLNPEVGQDESSARFVPILVSVALILGEARLVVEYSGLRGIAPVAQTGDLKDGGTWKILKCVFLAQDLYVLKYKKAANLNALFSGHFLQT